MVNNLDLSAISHFGIDNKSPLEARRKGSLLFSRALGRGVWRRFWRKLLGKEYRLLDLSQVARDGRRQPAQQARIASVPLANIIGSEGRVDDFDSAFNPLGVHNKQRWIGIAAARRQGAILPPVELIQVGEAYFVRDGHHRISVAKAVGQLEIEAQIVYMVVN